MALALALSTAPPDGGAISIERTLIGRARRGDGAAFRLIFERHAAPVRRFLWDLLRDDASADDGVQETFVRAHRLLAGLRDDAKLAAWLFGIARNLVRRVYRDRAVASRGRARLGLPVAVPDEYGDLIERLAAEQTLSSLDEQLAGLPEPQRDALELRVLDELDYEEIGQRLAITPEGARTRVFRALATLRAQIGRST